MKKKVYYKKEEFSFLLNEKRKAVCLLFRPEKRGGYMLSCKERVT